MEAAFFKLLCWSPRDCAGSGWKVGMGRAATLTAAAPVLAILCVYLSIILINILVEEKKVSSAKEKNQKTIGWSITCSKGYAKELLNHSLESSRPVCVMFVLMIIYMCSPGLPYQSTTGWGLKKNTFIFSLSGSWTSTITVSVGPAPPEAGPL